MVSYKLFFILAIGSVCVISKSEGMKLRTSPPVCPNDGEHFFPDPEDCSRYYHCSLGIAYLKSCPANLHWNQHLLQCDRPENVNCDAEPTNPPPPTTTTTTTTEAPEMCPPDGDVFLPVPGNCKAYIRCVNGVPIPGECPDGTLFDPVTRRCVNEGQVDCDQIPTTTTTRRPEPTTTVTQSPTTVIVSTPSNPTTPNNPTQNPTTTTRPTPTQPPGDFHCPADEAFIYMPHPESCNLFYWCEQGEYKGTSNCGTGLWFSFNQQACVYPEDSDCKLQSTRTRTQ